eukprot:GGOE01041931.1.p1 GENE.GGOE01041931.1~~GGOE01041931.1.p1  ORF type:complete len:951 (+),score=240.84 GGOE01041931.1:96-2855(+)
MSTVTHSKTVTVSVTKVAAAPNPGPPETEVEQLQRAVQEAESRNESLQGRLLRCQQVLDAIRSKLYAETCLLKEKVYQRTQTGELLEMEVCSLLDVVMEFLREQAGDIFQDPLHFKKAYSVVTYSNEEEQAMALEIALIRKKIHMEAMVTEGRLRKEISIRDQQLVEYREQLERCNPALFHNRLQATMQAVQILRCAVRDMRNMVFDAWRQESAAMTTDVVVAALEAQRWRQADQQQAVQAAQAALRTCVAHLEQSVRHHRRELAADAEEAIVFHVETWMKDALATVPEEVDGSPTFLTELRGLATAITDSCSVTDAFASRLKRVRARSMQDAEQRVKTQINVLKDQLSKLSNELAAALAQRQQQQAAHASDLATERSRLDAQLRQLEAKHASELRALTASYEVQMRRAEKDEKWFADRLERTVAERLASFALSKDQEMVALVEAKDQQIRFIKEALEREQAQAQALLPRLPEIQNVGVQCTLLMPKEDENLLEVLGTLRKELEELQLRLRTAEAAQAEAEQDVAALQGQLEEARRSLAWHAADWREALNRRSETTPPLRMMSMGGAMRVRDTLKRRVETAESPQAPQPQMPQTPQMVSVGVGVAWESRPPVSNTVTLSKKSQTSAVPCCEASTQTDDCPPAEEHHPPSDAASSASTAALPSEALPPDADQPEAELQSGATSLSPKLSLSAIFRNEEFSLSESDSRRKPTSGAGTEVETQTSARSTADAAVVANLGPVLDEGLPSPPNPDMQPPQSRRVQKPQLVPAQSVWECAACGEVHLPNVGKCTACGRIRRARVVRPNTAPLDRPPPSRSPKSRATPRMSPRTTTTTTIISPPPTSFLPVERKGRKHRQLVTDVELLRRKVPVYQPVDIPVLKPANPVSGMFLDQLPLLENSDGRQYPDVQCLGLWRYLLKGEDG